MNMINYSRIGEALGYYEKLCKYKLIEVPWLVSKEAIDVTKPPALRYFDTFAGHLVGSGEQSLLEIRSRLTPNQRYVCATPCFRDEPEEDYLHLQYFFKVELMHVLPVDEKAAMENMLKEAHDYHAKHKNYATGFYTAQPTVDVVATSEGFDINVNGIEVGSYGIREYNKFLWVYGTGLAEPRFTQALERMI